MTREPDCGHLALIASGKARGLCPLCQRAEIERLTTGIDRIVGLCLSDAGIGKIHARLVALLADEEPRP